MLTQILVFVLFMASCHAFPELSVQTQRQEYLNPPQRPFTLPLPLYMAASSSPTESIREQQIQLESGANMQVLSLLPESPSITTPDKPPILLLHGSFHGAWCWTEHFFPYLASRGYPVVALSWRGTGGTSAGEGVKKVKIADHVADLKCVLDRLPEILALEEGKHPILVAHSFAGLAVMKMLEEDPSRASKLGGICMMCSVPPSGNGKLTLRYLKRSLVDSYRITVGFAMKKCLTNEDLCRRLFFGGPKITRPDGSIQDYGVSDDDVKRYQGYFARDSKATIDLLDLAKKLPSSKSMDGGLAPFCKELPKCLVIGGTDDFIVDREGVEETARFFNATGAVFVDSPHDVMLGAKWENAARTLANWLEGSSI
jgi:pimeloyl-ACP methyl ester carboxylesterase